MAGDDAQMSTQRQSILAATARTIARRGYEATTIFEIAVEAGVAVRDVRRLVGDEEACFVALFSATFHDTFTLVLERTRDTPWPQSARDALATFLELLAAEPVRVRACVDGVRALGEDGCLRLESAIEAFTAFLTPGFTANEATPVFHGNLLGATVVHVVAQHVREDRIEELPAALPQLLGVALIPFCDAQAIDALLIAS
jgi:AcrR family transcriptional regulator